MQVEEINYITESLIGEEQCGFRRGRGCMDQVFMMRQLSEKFMSKGKSLYVVYRISSNKGLGTHLFQVCHRTGANMRQALF